MPGGAPPPPPPVTFNPTDWPGCVADWVAEDVTVSADPINWASRVGSLTFSASSTARPTAGDPFDGKASLRFSGSPKAMTGPNLSALFSSSTSWSMYLVLRMKAFTQQTYLNSSFANGNPILTNASEYFSIGGRTDHGGQIFGAHFPGSPYRYSTIHTVTNRILVVAYRGDPSGSGMAYLSLNDSTPVPASATNSTIASLGALKLGGGNTLFADFEVARIFAYNAYTSTSDHAAIVAAARAYYGAPSESWSPITPAKPSLWLDPSRSFKFKENSTANPATTAGDTVGRLDAAEGTNVEQATAGARPTLTTLGGLWALLGDGTDDRLTSSQTIADAAATLAVVYKFGSALGTSTRQILTVVGVAGSKRWSIHVAGATASLPYLSWTLAGASSTAHVGVNTTVADTARHVLAIVYLGGDVTNVANWKCWIDGVPQTIVTRAALTPAGTTSVLARSDGVTACSAVWGEKTVYEKAFSDAEAEALSTYLLGRWAA